MKNMELNLLENSKADEEKCLEILKTLDEASGPISTSQLFRRVHPEVDEDTIEEFEKIVKNSSRELSDQMFEEPLYKEYQDEMEVLVEQNYISHSRDIVELTQNARNSFEIL